MKLFNLIRMIRNLFHKKPDLSVTEVLLTAEKKVVTRTIGGKTYKVLWAVKDLDNGLKTVKEGFSTKAEARAYAESSDFKWYLMPYEVAC